MLERLAKSLSLGGVLDDLRALCGGYELLAHWTQGEFHHDVVVQVKERRALPAEVLVIATNCNGGVKEIIAFDSVPDRSALWHWRCPDSDEFAGELPALRERATTVHYFDPCELLRDDARSELKPECRVRQPGGGWQLK
ncbi:MAG TPA: hypothetical protein VGM90_23855 [Kofleriaceae bacterium]|jgi:hypothetical protein